MAGLARTSASTVSLLLNLESVLTAALAWIVFKENVDHRLLLGMLAIVAGGAVLAWSGSADVEAGWIGPVSVAFACLCWAIDNNFTRKVSANDAAAIAMMKGLAAGTCNAGLAFAAGQALPSMGLTSQAMAIGFFGYGVSLVLFVLALRGLGAARTGAYFSTAPFIGAALSILLLGEATSTGFWIAGALMAFGVWLHLTERHEHRHAHETQDHEHSHTHDEHHRHEHDFAWDGKEPHAHPHHHATLEHAHAHYPDIHHHHPHGSEPT
jgi:drug/metabolite transporter (DMT)-like permease